MQKRSSRLESIAFVLIALTSSVTAGAVVYRTFLAGPPARAARAEQPTFLEGWETVLPDGIRTGAPSAPIQVVVFTDLECPFCERFHGIARDVRNVRSDVAITWLHYPLERHRFARPAAHAAECAHDQGRFDGFIEAVYTQQDSLGLMSWSDFAAVAEVPDMARFEGCLTSGETPERIELGLSAGRRIGVHATPTILINGWRVSPPRSVEEFDRQIEEAVRRSASSAP
jgi:protein-disulfide isomerase